MTRTIRLEQAKMLKAVREDGTPLVPEPQQDTQPQILVQPNISFNPEIKIPPAEAPIINVSQPDITVQAADMEPVAKALAGFQETIAKSIRAIPAPVVNVAPIDIQPIAAAINNMAQMVYSKPDNSGKILDVLKQIANRPQNAQWRFTIHRDSHGQIENIEANKECTTH